MSLIAVTDSYYQGVQVAPQRVHVDDPAAHRFSRAVQALLKALKDETATHAWESLARLANATRWRGIYDPVPFSSKASTTAPLLTQLAQDADHLRASVPAHIQLLITNLCAAAETYLAADNQPFAASFARAIGVSNRAQTYLVARNRKTAIAIETWFRTSGDQIQVLVPSEYARQQAGQLAVLCGPGFVFPPQMLTAPRAFRVELVHHHWVRDRDKVLGIFGQFATVPFATSIREPVRPAAHWQPWSGTPVSELSINPDWEAVMASAPRTSGSDTETVRARLTVLGGGHAIWLPDQAERIRGLDPSAPPGERVFSMPMSTVAQGSILVLRSGVSESTTTRSVAYALLGEKKARQIQRLQGEWKRRLRMLLEEEGPHEVTRKLRSFGATVNNISYWASEELIQPRKVEHFKVLLHMLQIPDAAPYIEAGQTLRSKVVTAAHRLADALERKVDSCDLRQLEVDGMLELHLDVVPGAAPMTAYRVLAVREEFTEVVLHDCRRPFVTQGVEWLE